MPASSYFPPRFYTRVSGSSRSRMDWTRSNGACALQRIQLSLENCLAAPQRYCQSCFSQIRTYTEPHPISLPLVAGTAASIHMGVWQGPRPRCYHLAVQYPPVLSALTCGQSQIFSSLSSFLLFYS